MKGTPSVTKVKAKDWEGIPNQEYVHKIGESNYTSFLKSHGSVLVMFYAPCKYFMIINNTLAFL